MKNHDCVIKHPSGFACPRPLLNQSQRRCDNQPNHSLSTAITIKTVQLGTLCDDTLSSQLLLPHNIPTTIQNRNQSEDF